MGRRSPFTKTHKRDAVFAVLSGRQTVSEVCREFGISAQTITRWRSSALDGMENALADTAVVSAVRWSPRRLHPWR